MPLGSEVLDALKSSAIKIGTEETMGFLLSQFPWLGLSIINPIAWFLVGVVVRVIIEKTSLGAKYLVIDHATAKEATDFSEAVSHNQAMQQLGSEQEKKAAQDALIAAARKLIVMRAV